MTINIPERWWMYITIFTGLLSVIMVAVVVLVLRLRNADDEVTEEGTATPAATQIAVAPIVTFEALPTEAPVGVGQPVRIWVQHGSGLESLSVYLNDRLVWAPQILQGQTNLVTAYPWIPIALGNARFRVVAVSVDGGQAQQFRNINVVENDNPNNTANQGFTLDLQERDDPFDIARGFGVCPTALIAANPDLANIAPGMTLFVPTANIAVDSAGQPTTTCEEPPTNFFNNPQIGGVRICENCDIFPIDSRLPLARGFGCAPFYTGASPSNYGITCPPGQDWFHTGIDIGASKTTSLISIVEGTVTFAGPQESDNVDLDCSWMNGSEAPHIGYGNYVVLKSENREFLYAHLSEILVQQGDQVRQFQVIGKVGSTGCSTAPHLHFEVRQYDSTNFVSGRRFRLQDPIEYFDTVVANE